MKNAFAILCLCLVFSPTSTKAQESLLNDARQAMVRAATFFHKQVAVEGGYVYLVSSDLKYREGEGVADAGTVWVQPPGTPAVGLAFLEAYQRTGETCLLDAAKDAGDCLVRGQLHSGGWQDHIDFGKDLRSKLAYRVDGPAKPKARNLSTFDDDKTQAAVRFLAQLDKVLEFKEPKIHESVVFALDSILKNQFPNGGWAQVYDHIADPTKYPVMAAKYPENWVREYPGGDYWFFYTLNDNNISRTIDTLLLASEIYQEPAYRQSAIKAADFLLLAQMPEPQPAWAQQYDFQMQPVWARKFEPPSICGHESQEVIESLCHIYVETGNRKYLEPIPRALDYLQRSQLPDGRLARFYELKTNTPLYFTKDYKLTYSSDSMPTHYGFITNNSVAKLRNQFDRLNRLNEQQLEDYRAKTKKVVLDVPSSGEINQIIRTMDARGAWVQSGKLQYHKENHGVDQIVRSDTFIRNMRSLSLFVSTGAQTDRNK